MNIYYISCQNALARHVALGQLIDELGEWWDLYFSATEIQDKVWCARQIPRIKKERDANRKQLEAELNSFTAGDFAEAHSLLAWHLEEEEA